jgi:GH35 family endo-1,4-beta-xylanase
LPTITISKELEGFRFKAADELISFVQSNVDLHILVWFCQTIGFEFLPAMNSCVKKITDTLDIKVRGGHFKPEVSLTKVYDTIAKMSAWKKAGLTNETLTSIAKEAKNLVAYKVAKALNSNLMVSMRTHTLLML